MGATEEDWREGEEEEMSGNGYQKLAKPAVAYGIDIGVYRHRRDGRVRANTTFAWARASSAVELIREEHDGESEFRFVGEYHTGRDIRDLAQAIDHDFQTGQRIAIGMEAPMWQPAATAIPIGAFDLFPLRLAQERGFAWYLQSGAAALARAITTGRLLFSLLRGFADEINCSTDPSAEAKVELFEGFVVDRWKLPAGQDLADGPHAWDALTAAVAYHYARRDRSAIIHSAGEFQDALVSHWKTILRVSGWNGELCAHDCMVVGFDSQDGR